jgi:hypothetical protein
VLGTRAARRSRAARVSSRTTWLSGPGDAGAGRRVCEVDGDGGRAGAASSSSSEIDALSTARSSAHPAPTHPTPFSNAFFWAWRHGGCTHAAAAISHRKALPETSSAAVASRSAAAAGSPRS